MNAQPKLRLFVDDALAEGAVLSPSPEQTHYLLNVMRAASGENVALFNGRDGEWRACLRVEGRRKALWEVLAQLRPQTAEPDLWLLFAPVKRQRLDLIVEKATELGVSALLPVWTQNTASSRVNEDRLRATAIEAAEQCRRLSIPAIEAPRPLETVLGSWPDGRHLIVLDERGGGAPIGAVLPQLPPGPLAVLVGPEGGFSTDEIDGLSRLSFTQSVGLGPRILRADTAVVAALACLQSSCGDWRDSPAGRHTPLSGAKD
ncbi:MAG: 16S rRNA (uracil(1498)-N(3))-methyltransferase [Rhodospirillaceae bacterium]|nr:16S rRNA (uracil(1498)-N(3))-methyltransferase [Rhodospirillaceae bacterium]